MSCVGLCTVVFSRSSDIPVSNTQSLPQASARTLNGDMIRSSSVVFVGSLGSLCDSQFGYGFSLGDSIESVIIIAN